MDSTLGMPDTSHHVLTVHPVKMHTDAIITTVIVLDVLLYSKQKKKIRYTKMLLGIIKVSFIS